MTRSNRTTATPRLEALEDRSVPAFLAPVTSNVPHSAAGDFNGDGKADLVILDTAADTVAIRIGNGDGTFQAAGPAHSVSTLGREVALADFTGDGRLDAVVTSGKALVLLPGGGDGTFGAPSKGWSWIDGERLSNLSVADLNRDGRADLVLTVVDLIPGDRGLAGRQSYIRGVVSDPTTTFKVAFSVKVSSVSSTLSNFNYKTSPAFQVGDIDGDGDDDVLTIASAGTKPYPSVVLNNDGTGKMTVGAKVKGIDATDVTLADLNGDGKADLISRDNTRTVVMLGNGNGTFTKSATLPPVVGQLRVADVNGDGKPDLIGVDPATATVSVTLSKGGGKFESTRRTFSGGAGPIDSVFVGDFDGDGKLDLGLGLGSARLSVLFNDGAW